MRALAAAYCLPPFSLHFLMFFTFWPLLQKPALSPPSPGLAEAANGAATNITAMRASQEITASPLQHFFPSVEMSPNKGCLSKLSDIPELNSGTAHTIASSHVTYEVWPLSRALHRACRQH